MAKTFPLEVVLSSIYGILLCNIGEVYKFLDFVFDTSFYTHQLGKAGKQAQPIIEAQHPFLKEIDLSNINTENVWTEVDKIKAEYPNEIEIKQAESNYKGGLFQDLEEIINK